jgi:hypothetical protein
MVSGFDNQRASFEKANANKRAQTLVNVSKFASVY